MDKRIFVCIACFIFLLNCGISSAWTDTQITTNKADQTSPSIWNNYIVWQDARNGGSDIYLQNLANKIETRITKGVDAEYPCVSGNKIVWQDKRNGNWDIYMYDISNKKTTRITTNTADQTSPGAYGDYIVWQDARNGDSDIYLHNLATKVQTKIATDGYEPAIYGNNIVWITVNGYGELVMLYNISTKKTTVIASGPISPYSLSIYGNRIMCNDMYTDHFTLMYDFSTKKTIALPFDYVDNPAMYSNKIVYDDSRNGNSDIYMCTISDLPVADFSASPTSGKVPLKVRFTDKSTGSPTSWTWTFGDGGTSKVQKPAYTYSKAGIYTVTLKATNAAGSNTVTKSQYITVTAPASKPVAAFSASPTSGKAPLKVQFTDKSTGSPTSWKWTFGDGTYSTTKSPAHKYTKVGKYTVSLTVKNAAGSNTAKKTSYITVK